MLLTDLFDGIFRARYMKSDDVILRTQSFNFIEYVILCYFIGYVLKFQILIENKRAVGVSFLRNGSTFISNANREVIVAAGAVGSAQLLMLSGIGPRTHLEQIKVIFVFILIPHTYR